MDIALCRRRLTGLFWICLLFPAGSSGCLWFQNTELTINWATESEIDIIGFNIFRSESPDGPFSKINEVLIPPARDPFVGGNHTYTDDNVTAGITYHYQLETVDRHGNTERSETISITAGN